MKKNHVIYFIEKTNVTNLRLKNVLEALESLPPKVEKILFFH